MRRLACVAAALAVMALAAPARAQSILPFAAEGRVGLAFPTGDFGEGLGLGYGLGANATFNLLPLIGVYGGYSYTSFDLDTDVRGDEDAYNLQGFDAGLRVAVPTPGIALSPYLRGGVVWYKGELSGGGAETDRNLGFQLGAGLDYSLGVLMSLTPEVSYVRLPAGDGGGPDANFFRADFGLRLRL
ncbi:MAG TPA: outer membrane beta-barrel protein [Longimicrobiaceae bacterium]